LLILAIGALVLVLLWQPLFTAGKATPTPKITPALPDAGPVILTDAQDAYPLGLHMQFLEDRSGRLTIDEVASPEFDSRFTQSQVVAPTFGYTDSAYWIRFSLLNKASPTERWVLQMQFPNMHYVDLYTPRADGTGFSVKQTGVMRPLSTRDFLVPWSVFEMATAGPVTETYYVRLQTGSAMQTAQMIWKEPAFLGYAARSQLMFGLFLGALLGLVLYNLFVLVYVRDVKYLYVAIILAGMVMQEAARAGYTELYLFPGLYEFKKYYHAIPLMIAFAGMVVFSDTLLEMKRLQILVHRGNQVVVAGFVLLALWSLWLPYYKLAEYTLLWGIASLLVGCLGGVMSWRQNFAPARLLLLAWIALVMALYGVVLTRVGVFPSTLATENSYRVAIVVLGLSSSIALASRMSRLRNEARDAYHDLQRSQARQAQVLEAMPLAVAVYGRDMRPEYFNRRLAELVGDPLVARADLAARRTLAQAIRQFSFKRADSDEPYPLEDTPAYRALHGVSASADDIEMAQGDRRIPLEAWASPLTDDAGQVDAAVLVLSDVTERKRAEAELLRHRQNLEELVRARTAELEAVNKELQLHLDWLNAIGRVHQVAGRRADFSDVYERIGRITKGLFGSQDAFIAEWDGRGRQMHLLTHSCKHDQHPVPAGSETTMPEKVVSSGGAGSRHLVSISEVWGDELNSLDGPLGDHIRAARSGTVVLVSMPVPGPGALFLGLEMPGWTAALTSRETQLLRTYAIDIARVIENAHLFEQAKTLATLEERNRLARELHDSVAQALFGVSLYTDATQMALKSRKLEVVRSHLQELAGLSRQAMLDMRLLIFELRPSTLEQAGLVSSLQGRLDSVESKAGMKAIFHSKGEIRLSPQQETELYRIAQEALNNVVKHAKADVVKVQLIQDSGTVRLSVEDDGVGFDPELAGQKGGHGLRGMRERADRIGATLFIESESGRGSKVAVEVKP
jgi:signal transduction histidine kinase/PAS domain-containing protein